MERYIGITIGPIYRTIQSARSTGELWGSSYIFSYMMKRIISKLKSENKQFIVPYVDDNKLFAPGNKVGLFHDRLIFIVNADNDYDLVKKVVTDVINEIANNITNDLNNKSNPKKYSCEEVKKFIEDYFQIHYVEINLKEGANPILEVSKVLDAIELRQTFIPKIKSEENTLREFLKNHNIKNSFLAKDAFGNDKEVKFRSIEEIANVEFKDCSENEKILKRKAHKYIAVVQADGDNMGNLIKNIWNSENDKLYKEFSKNLLEFSIEASKIIEDYGGMNIFAGGDDLLFFAPVINKDENIFDLLDKINGCFENKFQKIKEATKNDFTLSFGVSITYYKYPLYEALEMARNLLFNYAKNTLNKNSIAFKVIKHSGQYFGDTLYKSGEIYNYLKQLLKQKMLDQKFLRSLQYKISKDKCILINILNNKQKLKNYFDNNFNEDTHKNNELRKYLEDVNELIFVAYNELTQNNRTIDDIVIAIQNYLKLIKFMNEAGTDDE